MQNYFIVDYLYKKYQACKNCSISCIINCEYKCIENDFMSMLYIWQLFRKQGYHRNKIFC